ncbi:hypothetical protein BY458DRAFT_504692 [Sporodiniella umbellata]|nr:hypothetical protein BY458DRAFT_504692 [Sporodiniella umbellata]
MEELRSLLKLKEKSQSTLENDMAKLTEEIHVFQAQKAELEQEHQSQLLSSQESSRTLSETLEKLKQENRELKDNLRNSKDRLAAHELEAENRKKEKESQTRLSSQNEDELKKALADQQNKVKDLLAEMETLKTKNKTLKQTAQEPVSEDSESLKDELEASKKEIKKIRGQMALIKGQLKKSASPQEVQDLRNRIQELELAQNDPDSSENKKLTDIYQADVKRQLQTRDKKIQELQQKADRLVELEKRYSELEKTMADQQDTLDALNKAKEEALESEEDRKLSPSEAEIKIHELRAHVRTLEEKCKITPEREELENKLQRQFEAFTTIRNELAVQRERQSSSEAVLQREKSQIDRERQELRVNVDRMKVEYEEQLEKMWTQHEAMRSRHENNLTSGRTALDSAQTKLLMNGHSPVSESGFDWINHPDEEEEESEGVSTQLVPAVGKLPPLEKPLFNEFMEVPQCSGCLSKVINI